MNLPRHIQIGGHLYEVILTENINILDGCSGLHRPNTRQIIISAEVAPSNTATNLYHEILHAINAIYISSSERLSESQVEGIAQGLTQVLPQLGLNTETEGFWELDTETWGFWGNGANGFTAGESYC